LVTNAAFKGNSMSRFVNKAAAVFALTGLVLSQPAFAVRSYESLPTTSANAAGHIGRVSSRVGSTEEVAGVPTIGILLALGIVIAAGVIIAGDSNHNNKSPG
jgi:hypothetical protein